MERVRQGRYERVEKLPEGAVTVKVYAEKRGCAQPHVYKLYNLGRIDIVVWMGINWVLEKDKS